jgi:hypothetical protein
MQQENADFLAVRTYGYAPGIRRLMNGHADVPFHIDRVDADDILDVSCLAARQGNIGPAHEFLNSRHYRVQGNVCGWFVDFRRRDGTPTHRCCER